MRKNNSSVEGPGGLVYAARLPLSSATLNWLADLIRGHLKKIGSRWRALPAGKIATIVLAVLRCDQRPGDLVGGNGVHRTTVTRWVREVVGLLAARAPRLDRALKKIARKNGRRHRTAGRIGDPYPAQNREGKPEELLRQE